ncbi:hypothetical protein [uncultured Brevundimonas sp.]|uniref:hypothetical protein n=1 Tax=uncultured Brevundimonas sp. TaxID=213418 RepID=UPI00262D3BF1|nr:hypothetical protein [uncultured Brevundimonas sp.]
MRALALSLAVLAVAGCSVPPAVDERPALIAQRVAKLEQAKASGLNIAKFDCPARTVSDRTAETMLLMWVNERTDLVDRSNLRTASDDMISAFQTCGANMNQIMNELERSDDLLMFGLSIAILQQGRGLT